jgi:hypothetical protein
MGPAHTPPFAGDQQKAPASRLSIASLDGATATIEKLLRRADEALDGSSATARRSFRELEATPPALVERQIARLVLEQDRFARCFLIAVQVAAVDVLQRVSAGATEISGVIFEPDAALLKDPTHLGAGLLTGSLGLLASGDGDGGKDKPQPLALHWPASSLGIA